MNYSFEVEYLEQIISFSAVIFNKSRYGILRLKIRTPQCEPLATGLHTYIYIRIYIYIYIYITVTQT